ncbi:MAG: hypothetical protein FWD04_00465 [Conexibacteraceae bacterium]|nr:hypothetical protein [Conexibacteraceae bacterium]
MDEILPGIWHWTAPNPGIGGTLVASLWLDAPGVLIDPLLPDDVGIDWFAARPTPPVAVALANRHHFRSSGEVRERFGAEVFVPALGLHEFSDRGPVTSYSPGDALPGGLVPFTVGSLSPDDGGFHLGSASALWLADTVVRSTVDPESEIGFVPDFLMDDPGETKRGLLAAFTRLLDEYEFEHLLLAHGLPLIGNGRSELERLVRDGGRTAAGAF